MRPRRSRHRTAKRRRCWRRTAPAGASPTRPTAPTPARPRRPSTARPSPRCSGASGCRRSPTSTPASGPTPPARVADVGCGAGWSSIALARAYPQARVDGFDLDAPSIELARRHAAAAGVADRVAFHARDAADPALAGAYDLVLAFETIHDMARPVEALRTMGRLAGAGGAVIVMDERVGEAFTAPGDPTERLFYGSSILFCLPTGLADGTPERPSAGTGTVMRPATFRRYALEAGFGGVEILPIEHDFFRFYRLVA